MFQDVRYALRLLLRSRGFAATAIVSMACGIAACVAVFSLTYAILFRPLPVARAEDVIAIYGGSRTKGTLASISMPDYQDLARRSDLFDGIGAYFRSSLVVDTEDGSERVAAEMPTGQYHTMLGLRPALGRLILPDDDRAGAQPVIVLSEAYWRRRFGADPSAIGRTLRVQNVTFEIVGVAPAAFSGVLLDWYGAPDVWLPLAQLERINARFARLGILQKRETPWLQVTARLKRGVDVPTATAALQAHASNVAREYPRTHADISFWVTPTSHARFWPGRRASVLDFAAVLMTIVGVLLLIAVLNVANLLLARLTTRQREIGIRLAIGADRIRLARQLSVEGLVLSGLSTLASIPISIVLTRTLAEIELPFFVRSGALDLSPDWRVFAGVAALFGITGLLLGLAPAWRVFRSDVRSCLTNAPASGHRRPWVGQWELRHTLAALQIAVSLILTLGAGLLGKSFFGLLRTDLGYRAEGVMLFGLDSLSGELREGDDVSAGRALLTRVRGLPGVENAGFAHNALPSSMRSTRVVMPVGRGSADARTSSKLALRYNAISPGYLEAVQLPLVAGRAFEERDTEGAPSPVAIVNELLARRLWRGVNHAVGQRIRVEGETLDREVIGVTRTAVYGEVDEAPMPYLFLPIDRAWQGDVTLHVRGRGDAAVRIAEVQRELRAVDRRFAFSDIRSLDEHIASRIAAPSMAARLSIAASVVGIGLALVGLYAVLAYLVSQRRAELAIRMSLGAGPAHIRAFVAGYGLKIVMVGAVLGLGGAALVMRLLATQLRGVEPYDPLVYLVVTPLVLLAALVACVLPVRRAARLEPWSILRQ